MDPSPSLSIWKIRRGSHVVRCVFEQLGENCFELRLFRDKRLLVSEDFDEPEPLLARADELREQVELNQRPRYPRVIRSEKGETA